MKAAKVIRSVSAPIALIALWQLLGAENASPDGIPVPSNVARTGWQMIEHGELASAMSTSTIRVLIGFSIAAVAGIVLGMYMGFVRQVERNLDPLVQTFRMVAAIALAPLALIWFGPNGKAAIFIVAYGAFFPVIINTIAGVKQVDPVFARAARTMGLSTRRILRTVLLPGSLPMVFVGLRLGLGAAWGAIIAAELTVGVSSSHLITAAGISGGPAAAAHGGIGYLMFFFYNNSVETGGIIVAMVAVGATAFVMDRIIRMAQQRLTPWAQNGR